MMLLFVIIVVRQNCVKFPDPAFGPLGSTLSHPGNASELETA